MPTLSAAGAPVAHSVARNPLAILSSPISFYQKLSAQQAPSFWLPLLLITVASWSFTALSGSLVGFGQIAANEMANRGMTVADASTSGIISAVIMLSWPVTFAIVTLLASLVLYAVFVLALGYSITLRQVMAVSFYSFLPRLIKYALSIIPLVVGSSAREHFLPSNPLPTNPGYFIVDAGLSHGVMTVLTSLDFFTLWSLALIALGIGTISKRSFAYAAGVVGLCWAVSLSLKALMS